jgi:hypothetical protein
VEAFWQAELAAGGTDDAAPGVSPGDYAAFLKDPHSNPVETICHNPE